jgi:hypothetical protein
MITKLKKGHKTICIRPDAGGYYKASFASEILGASYEVRFKSTITGAIALHNFSEMISRHYGNVEVDFSYAEKDTVFESVLDVLRRDNGKRTQR